MVHYPLMVFSLMFWVDIFISKRNQLWNYLSILMCISEASRGRFDCFSPVWCRTFTLINDNFMCRLVISGHVIAKDIALSLTKNGLIYLWYTNGEGWYKMQIDIYDFFSSRSACKRSVDYFLFEFLPSVTWLAFCYTNFPSRDNPCPFTCNPGP